MCLCGFLRYVKTSSIFVVVKMSEDQRELWKRYHKKQQKKKSFWLLFIDSWSFLCPATRKWRGIMLYPPKFWVSVRPSVRLSVCPSVRPSVRPSVSAHHHSCIGNSSYSLGQSFWNFTGVLRMVWRYAYCFFRILKLFFITFFPFLT